MEGYYDPVKLKGTLDSPYGINQPITRYPLHLTAVIAGLVSLRKAGFGFWSCRIVEMTKNGTRLGSHPTFRYPSTPATTLRLIKHFPPTPISYHEGLIQHNRLFKEA